MSFKGKVVLITGASSGIGAETAIHFSKLGASLVLVGRNAANLDAVSKKAESLGVIKPLTIVADVNKDTDSIITKTIDHFGQLDVLINNAGFSIGGSIETSSLNDYDSIMNTNVRSVYHLTMLAVPHLIKTKGNIVNVSSICGIRAFSGILSYCISKAAMDQFTKCVSLELAPKGVRVNSVNPAVIVTNFLDNMGLGAEEKRKFLENAVHTHPMGRVGTPDEVASAIAFLADDTQSSFITGTLLLIDGGRGVSCPR